MRLGRSIREEHRQAGSSATATGEALWFPAQVHLIYKDRVDVHPRSLFSFYATPPKARRTHCATNDVAWTALITGLLRHTPEIWRSNIDASGTADLVRAAT